MRVPAIVLLTCLVACGIDGPPLVPDDAGPEVREQGRDLLKGNTD